MTRLQKHLRNTFLAGAFAAAPLAVTVLLIWYVETSTREPLRALFGLNVPFIGVAVALGLIYVLGLLVTSLIGRFFLNAIDRLLLRVPGLRELYQAWKHVSLNPGGKEGIFARVVLIPVESGEMWTLGFTSGDPVPGDERTCCVFVPAAPNPTSGRLYFVPRADCRMLETTVEEAFKVILSGGNYVPGSIGNMIGRPLPANGPIALPK